MIINEQTLHVGRIDISYNWGYLSTIWHIKNTYDKIGKFVKKDLEIALAKIATLNLPLWDPNGETAKNNSSWSWGVGLSEEDKLSVFQYHLMEFLEVANNHLDDIFVSEDDYYNVHYKQYYNRENK